MLEIVHLLRLLKRSQLIVAHKFKRITTALECASSVVACTLFATTIFLEPQVCNIRDRQDTNLSLPYYIRKIKAQR